MLFRLIFVILLSLCGHFLSYAQSSAFVLVDVSGSGKLDIKMQAKVIVQDILTGKFLLSKYSPYWRWSGDPFKLPFEQQKGTTQPLLDVNNEAFLMIMPVGERNRYQNYKIDDIKNLSEVDNFFNNYYPRSFSDSYTYLDIARAKAAGVARNSNISSYFLIEISDGLNDTNTNAPTFTPEEQQLIDQYESDKAKPDPLAIFHYYEGSSSVYRIKFSTVAIEGTKIPRVPGKGVNTGSLKPEITLVRPNGTQAKPTEVNPGAINIAWKCIGCDTNALFTVDVVGVKGAKGKNSSRSTKNFGELFSIQEPGIYRVTVKLDNAVSKSAYFNVKGESSGSGLLFILSLLGLGGLLYFIWKKRRDNQFDDDAKNMPDDDVSQSYQPYKPNYTQQQESSQQSNDDF